jgi:hypothetical protein
MKRLGAGGLYTIGFVSMTSAAHAHTLTKKQPKRAALGAETRAAPYAAFRRSWSRGTHPSPSVFEGLGPAVCRRFIDRPQTSVVWGATQHTG